MSRQDGSCQKLRNCAYILLKSYRKNRGLFFQTRCMLLTIVLVVTTTIVSGPLQSMFAAQSEEVECNLRRWCML